MEHKELDALLSLLDDPDHEIFNHVSGKLMSYGTQILPTLESVWEGSFDPIIQERIEKIIHRIQFDGLTHEFGQWVKYDPDNLFEGAYLATKYQYSELKREQLRESIERIRRTIWLELNHNLTPLEQVNVFNHVMYSILQYSGKAGSKNFFLNKVLDNRCGNGLMLGILYLIIAHELDLTIYGVNLSRNFILAYAKDKVEFDFKSEDSRSKILFYINPLNRGTIFSRNEIQTYLEKTGTSIDTSNFVPCPNREIIALLLENMAEFYSNEHLTDKAEELRELKRMIK